MTTGVSVTRSLNIFIGCNQGGKETDPLSVIGYTEVGQCQYYIQTSHKLGCGVAGDPYDNIYLSPSSAPVAPSASFTPLPVAAAAQSASGGEKFGFSVLGIVLALPIAFAAFIILDSYNYLDALKLKFSNFRRSSSERAPLASSSMAYNRPSTMMTGTA